MNDQQRTALGMANNHAWESSSALRAVRKAGPLTEKATAELERAELLLVEFRAALDKVYQASEC